MAQSKERSLVLSTGSQTACVRVSRETERPSRRDPLSWGLVCAGDTRPALVVRSTIGRMAAPLLPLPGSSQLLGRPSLKIVTEATGDGRKAKTRAPRVARSFDPCPISFTSLDEHT